jgi:hypothetical protein
MWRPRLASIGGAVKGEFLIGLLAAVIPVCAAHAGPITSTDLIDNDPFGVFDSATFAGSYAVDSTMTQC